MPHPTPVSLIPAKDKGRTPEGPLPRTSPSINQTQIVGSAAAGRSPPASGQRHIPLMIDYTPGTPVRQAHSRPMQGFAVLMWHARPRA